MKNLTKLTILSLIIDALFAILIIKFSKIYLITILFSGTLQIVSAVYEKIRTKQLGFSVYKMKGYKGCILLDIISLLMPFVNVIYASIKYFQTTITTDARYVFTRSDKLEPFKETIKNKKINEEKDKLFYFPTVEKEEDLKIEYNEISKKEYEIAQKMVTADDYIDEIMMNIDLNKETKLELLKQMRKQMYLTNTIKTNPNKILKMSKNK